MALVQLLSWLCHCLGHAHTSMEQLGNDHTVNGTVSPLQKPLKNLT